jgi:hypothetical protein
VRASAHHHPVALEPLLSMSPCEEQHPRPSVRPGRDGSVGSTTDGMLSALASLILREGEGSEAYGTPASRRASEYASSPLGSLAAAWARREVAEEWEDEAAAAVVAALGGRSGGARAGRPLSEGRQRPSASQQGWRQHSPGGGLLAMLAETSRSIHQPSGGRRPPLDLLPIVAGSGKLRDPSDR